MIHMGFLLPALLVMLLAIWQADVIYDTWQSLKTSASAGAKAANSPASHVTLKRFSLQAPTSRKTATYTATACSAYAVNILGVVVKSGDLCRDATTRVG